MKKKLTYPKLPMKHLDYSHVKPPTRLAVEAMIENLHNAANNELPIGDSE